MNITLELTASPSLLEALRMLAGFANPVASFEPTARAINAPETTQTSKKAVEKSQEAAEAERSTHETTRVVETTTAEVTETTASTTKLTVEQVRAATSAKAKAGKRAEVKELLSKYDADSVTTMNASDYEAFYAELEAL